MLSSTLKIFSKQKFSRIRQFQIVVNKGYFLKKKIFVEKMSLGHVLFGNKRESYNKDPFMVK